MQSFGVANRSEYGSRRDNHSLVQRHDDSRHDFRSDAASQSAIRMSKVGASSASGVTVTIAGTTISTTADASGSFTLTGVPPIQIVLTFSGPGVDATLPIGAVGSSDYVQINVTITGNTATLNTQQTTSPDSTASLEGYIEAIDLNGRMVKVSGISIEVPTNAALTRGGAPIALSELKTTIACSDRRQGRLDDPRFGNRRAERGRAAANAHTATRYRHVLRHGQFAQRNVPIACIHRKGHNCSHDEFDHVRRGSVCGHSQRRVGRCCGAKQSDGSVLASYVSVSVPPPTTPTRRRPL